jgi:hypothetical protein
MATHIIRAIHPDHRVEAAISYGLQAATSVGAAILVFLSAAMSF